MYYECRPRVTAFCRLLVVSVLAASFIFKDEFDQRVSDVYDSLRSTWWFTHDTFEPLLSVVCLISWLAFWYMYDVGWPMIKRRMFPQSFTAEEDKLLQGRHYSWTVHGPQGYVTTKEDSGGVLSILTTRNFLSLVYYIVPLAAYDVFYPRRRLPVDAPTFHTLMFEVVAALFAYDTLFFVFHLALHKNKTLYKYIHEYHHKYSGPGQMTAKELIRLTAGEQVIDVGVSILALNILRCHPLSRALYDIVITWLLVELHSDNDLPWMAHRVVPGKIMPGPPAHSRHHTHLTHTFSKFFTPCDALLNKARSYKLV